MMKLKNKCLVMLIQPEQKPNKDPPMIVVPSAPIAQNALLVAVFSIILNKNNMSYKTYKADVYLKSQTTTEEDKFIFEQAEKKLKEILTSSDLVITRSTTLITLIVGLLVGFISFSVNRYNTNNSLDPFIAMSCIGVAYLFLVINYIGKNIKGTDHASIGASPEVLFVKDFFEVTQDEKVRTKMFIWSQIENYQDSIYINRPINEKKWSRFNLSMKLVIATPLILLVSFSIIRSLWF